MEKYTAKKFIRSLSRGQAMEFMWFADKRGRSAQFIRLFQMIRSSKQLSDSRISEAMEIPLDQLSTYTANLANRIIDFLAYKELTTNKILLQYLRSEALKRLGFTDRAEKELRKGFPQETMGLIWEDIFPTIKGAAPKEKQKVQLSGLYHDLIQLIQLKELNAKLDIGVKEAFLVKPHISAMESITSEYPILSQPEQIENPRVKAEYHDVKRRIYIYQMDWQKAEVHIRSFLRIVYQNESIQEELAEKALKFLEQLIRIEIERRNFEEIELLLPKIHAFRYKTRKLSLLGDITFHSLRITIAIETGNEELGKATLQPFLQSLKKGKKLISGKRYLNRCYSAALYCGMNGNWQESLKIIQEFWGTDNKPQAGLTWKYLVVFRCIALFETRNLWDLETAYNQGKRWLRAERKSSAYFQAFFDLFEEIQFTAEEQWPELIAKAHPRFLEIQKSPSENVHFLALNLLEWLEAKQKGKSWISIISLKPNSSTQINKSSQQKRA